MPLPLLPLAAGLAALYVVKRLTSKREQKPSEPDEAALRRLAALRAQPLPAELAVPTPRPDVWGEGGYLSQPHYHARFKPLLLQGHATHGLVYHYASEVDPDGVDTVAHYAWWDERGELQTRALKESYDGMHACLSKGQGGMVLDVDAELCADKAVVILHDVASGEHIVYEALRVTPDATPVSMRRTRRGRTEGALQGLLLGEALGLPYTGHPPELLSDPSRLELEPPADFARAHPEVPPGTGSEGGAHALCLLASLLTRGMLDPEDFMRRLLDWRERGYMAVEDRVLDVSPQTRTALDNARTGAAALEAGPRAEQDNGPGALTRVVPLVLWHRGDDAALVRDAMLQSQVTHGHLRSQVCCALYALWARRVLEGDTEQAWEEGLAAFCRLYAQNAAHREELERHVLPGLTHPGRGGTGVVDCLRSARDCVAAGSYEDVVKAAIALGGDTATTALVAGGIAGLRDGLEGIPERWRRALRGQKRVDPLMKKLLAQQAR